MTFQDLCPLQICLSPLWESQPCQFHRLCLYVGMLYFWHIKNIHARITVKHKRSQSLKWRTRHHTWVFCCFFWVGGNSATILFWIIFTFGISQLDLRVSTYYIYFRNKTMHYYYGVIYTAKYYIYTLIKGNPNHHGSTLSESHF